MFRQQKTKITHYHVNDNSRTMEKPSQNRGNSTIGIMSYYLRNRCTMTVLTVRQNFLLIYPHCIKGDKEDALGEGP